MTESPGTSHHPVTALVKCNAAYKGADLFLPIGLHKDEEAGTSSDLLAA
jgi:hypothetical protein